MCDVFTRDMTNPLFFFFTCPASASVCSFTISNLSCVPSICLSDSLVVLWLFVRFYVLTGILMLMYGSHNTVSTITPVSVAVFLLSEVSDLINVMSNMFSSTGSPSFMRLCCNTSCQFALYLYYTLIFGWTPFGCLCTRILAIAFETVTRVQCTHCNQCLML